jgi:molecular chaperone DnaK
VNAEPVIGIDLGTTHSVVATVQEGQPVVIRGRNGLTLTPSVVALSPQGKRLVGTLARRQAITNPQDTIAASKRLIGRKYSSPQVQEAMRLLPYKLVPGPEEDVRVVLGGKPVSLQEIGALILQELKADAEAWWGRPVTKAVITVPAYFNDGQRQATKEAGRIAGLEVLRILNEPTAAALAYGLGRSVSGKVAVFDLGGGTFDLSVLEVSNGVFDVVATGGDTWLGGEDWDQRVLRWLADSFQKEHGVDLRQDRMALQRLKDAAERAKIELSEAKQALINLPFLSTPPKGGSALHLQTTLTRERLEELTGDLGERALKVAAQVLVQARLKPADLREVVLVGGMTRMPRMVESVKRLFGREPHRGVHPEEVVALGAAVQAHALLNPREDMVLLDVTPQTLGVAVAGGYVRKLIPRNTTVPTAIMQTFTTARDNQDTVRILVLQGESEVAHRNELLGEFLLTELRPAPRGSVQVDVTFSIDADGIVSVSALDRSTGQQQSLRVTASTGLSEEELKRLLTEQQNQLVEAATPEELQRKRAELERTVYSLEGLLPRARKALQSVDFGEAAVGKAERLLEHARKVLGRSESATVAGALEQVGRSLQTLRELMQRTEQPGAEVKEGKKERQEGLE